MQSRGYYTSGSVKIAIRAGLVALFPTDVMNAKAKSEKATRELRKKSYELLKEEVEKEKAKEEVL